ncbi:MAG: hypothetical protein KTR31_00265 [Myxococcales bacterium]|nr:hypothetical protein [Myxococcales bacterium]
MAASYKYSKKAGAVQDAMVPRNEPPIHQAAVLSAPAPQQAMMRQSVAAMSSVVTEDEAVFHADGPPPPPAAPKRRGVAPVLNRTRANMAPPVLAGGGLVQQHAPPQPESGIDPHVRNGWSTMFFHTVEEGQQVLVSDRRGRVKIVAGPRRIWRWGKRIRSMSHYVAHPAEFLIVRFRDGGQEHLQGPAHCWFDPRVHLAIEKEDAVQLSAKEAVVVYAKGSAEEEVSRRIVHGPATFVPEPGEWLHTFRWHGPSPDAVGFQKVPGALVFQKLWLMPDQMYHDVADVRTADDAVLTIRLMLFFELVDIERMLVATHDPIGDFVNAATSDVVDFVGRCTLDSFKSKTEALNDLGTYRQLVSRAEQCGYRIDKVVYRGYGAPPALQRLHDEASESRVRLQLERATEQQAQELEDFKLDRSLARAAKERERLSAEAQHKLALAEQQYESARRRRKLDADQAEILSAAAQERERKHYTELAGMGVDLTALLTKVSPDHVLEVRGGGTPHVHLNRDE